MSTSQIAALYEAANAAWRDALDQSQAVNFMWEGAAYVSRLTPWRMLIETIDGNPIAWRYV